MSAEKEIVNYWYNKKGFFTINNIKTSSNRDVGILALRISKNGVDEIFHVQVSCSITSNVSEAQNTDKSINKIIEERFDEKILADSVKHIIGHLSLQKENIKNVMVVGALPKSSKREIIAEFGKRGVTVIEFEDILYDVLDKLDTQYYKNDVIRTLQLTKFLLLSEPAKLAKLLANDAFTSSSRKEFLSNILDNEEIIKEFKKTNVERLGAILKNSKLKPSEIAGMIEHGILNKKTRKTLLNSLIEQEKTRKIAGKHKRTRKFNMPLEKFFTNF